MDQQKGKKILMTRDAVAVFRDISDLIKRNIKTKKGLEKFKLNILLDADEIKKQQSVYFKGKKIAASKLEKIEVLLDGFELVEDKKFFVDRTVVASNSEVYEKLLPLKNYCELVLMQNESIDESGKHIIFVEDIDVDLDVIVPEIELSKFVFNRNVIKKIKEIYSTLGSDEFKSDEFKSDEFKMLAEIEEIGNEIFLFNDMLELDTEESRKKRAFLKEFEKYVVGEEDKINQEILKKVDEKQIKIDGKRLLLMNAENAENISGISSISSIPELKNIIKEVVDAETEKIIKEFDLKKSDVFDIFFESYPCRVNKESVESLIKKKKSELLEEEYEFKLKVLKKIKGKFEGIRKSCDRIYDLDVLLSIGKFQKEYDMQMPEISEGFGFVNGRNIQIKNIQPVTYSLGSEIEKKKVAILTGANSGGKTTLLKTILQIQILGQCGLGVPAEKCEIPVFEEIYFLSKYSGTLNAGAFESALRDLVKILTSKKKKLVLVDELEAITEPGAAAKIIATILEILVENGAFGVFVTHLSEDILKYVSKDIRVDGILATGLDKDLNLVVDHQPKFNMVGKSTPELIIEKMYRDVRVSPEEKKIYERILECVEKKWF